MSPTRSLVATAAALAAMVVSSIALTTEHPASAAPQACDRPLRVLLTNDDGWAAPGIQSMYDTLRAAGHEVWIVAPTTNQSGVSARLAYGGVLRVEHPRSADPAIAAVVGTPSDSVALGLSALVSEPVDVVVSGSNAGWNASRTTNHSGTVGAVTTALERGVVGVSVATGLPTDGTPAPYDDTARLTATTLDLLRDDAHDCTQLLPEGTGLNINYPTERARGVRSAEFAEDEAVKTTYTLRPDGGYDVGFILTTSPDPGVDSNLLAQGYATVTLLDGDLSAARDGRGSGVVERLAPRLDRLH
jgi:5'-nucleotidase